MRTEVLVDLLKVAGVAIGIVFALVAYDYLIHFDWSRLLGPIKIARGRAVALTSAATAGKSNKTRGSSTHQRNSHHDVAAEKAREARRLAAEKAAQRQADNHQQSQERAAELAFKAAAEARRKSRGQHSIARARSSDVVAQKAQDQMAHDWLT